MKKLVYILIGVLFVGCNGSSKKDDEKKVSGLLNDFITAVEDKNYSALDQLTTDDFVIYDNGFVWDFKQFTLKLEEYGDVNIDYELKDVHFIVDQNTVHAQFHNTGTFVHPDTTIVLDFIESAIFVKSDDNWQIKFYHSTHLK